MYWGTCKAGPNSGHNAQAQPQKRRFLLLAGGTRFHLRCSEIQKEKKEDFGAPIREILYRGNRVGTPPPFGIPKLLTTPAFGIAKETRNTESTNRVALRPAWYLASPP